MQLDDWVSYFVCKLPGLGSLWWRERERKIVLRILRENYSFSWRWGVETTRLPRSINSCLKEADILGVGGTTVLGMWPTFLNGNGNTHYSYLWLYAADDRNWSISTLSYQVSLLIYFLWNEKDWTHGVMCMYIFSYVELLWAHKNLEYRHMLNRLMVEWWLHLQSLLLYHVLIYPVLLIL